MDGWNAREVVDGQVMVTSPSGGEYRVLIPAGVGVPGADDADLACALVAELLARGGSLPPVVDASQILVRDPSVLPAVAARIEQR